MNNRISCRKGTNCGLIATDLDEEFYYYNIAGEDVCCKLHPNESPENYNERVKGQKNKYIEEYYSDEYEDKLIILENKVNYLIKRLDSLCSFVMDDSKFKEKKKVTFDILDDTSGIKAPPSSPVNNTKSSFENFVDLVLDEENIKLLSVKNDSDFEEGEETDNTELEYNDDSSYVPSSDSDTELYKEDEDLENYVVLSDEETESEEELN